MLEAMEVMSFPDFVDPLKASLEEFKKEQQDKKDKAKRTKAEKEAAKLKIKAEATLDDHLDQDGRKRKDPNTGEDTGAADDGDNSDHISKVCSYILWSFWWLVDRATGRRGLIKSVF